MSASKSHRHWAINLPFPRLWEWNAQLFREAKGKLKPRNIAIVTVVSLLAQGLMMFFYWASLPSKYEALKQLTNRYCLGSNAKGYGDDYCGFDLIGNVITNWQLWWLDIFIFLSVIGIFALIVGGMFMIIADLSKETSRGTFDFIRLSPHSAQEIAIGKILGVPILLYWGVVLFLPIHLISGLAAGIGVVKLIAAYGVLILACACFYTISLLIGLIGTKGRPFKAWIASGVVFLFFMIYTAVHLSSYINFSHTTFDWLLLFYPGTILSYLVDSTYLAPKTTDYFNAEGIKEIQFYYQSLFNSSGWGMALFALNYGVWTHWAWQGIQRLYYDSHKSAFNKLQSYLITGYWTILLLGFTLQSYYYQDEPYLSLSLLQFFLGCLFVGLIILNTPKRQTLQDWARYRHHQSNRHSLWRDLVLGENSPYIVAVAIANLIAICYILPSLILFNSSQGWNVLVYSCLGFVLGATMIVICALITQLILLSRSRKRGWLVAISLGSLLIMPPLSAAILSSASGSSVYGLILFSLVPISTVNLIGANTLIFSVFAQTLLVTGLGWQISRRLRILGQSESKSLLTSVEK